MSAVFVAYNRLLQRRPLLAQCVVTSGLFGVGDVLAQFAQAAVENKKPFKYDPIRTGRMAVYGGLIFAPIAVRWYKVLDRIPIKSRPALIATRVGLDQFAFAPVMLSVFFTAQALMDGKSITDSNAKLKTTLPTTLMANWTLFIPFQALNFSVVPLQHRLLTVNVVSLFWNTYLSLAANRDTPLLLSNAAIEVADEKLP